MTLILDGKSLSSEIRKSIKEEIKFYAEKGLRNPCIAVILVGEDPASKVYVNNKRRACEDVGIKSILYHLPINTKKEEITELIAQLNAEEEIDGILVQLPLPEHIDTKEIVTTINPKKDVDGFHPENMGKLIAGREDGFIPCTPLGIDIMLKNYNIQLEGANVTIVGAGFIVGRPLSALMLNRNATVTVCHIYTKNIKEFTLKADILISATGVPGLIDKNKVREGTVVIDVGINKIKGKIVGDVRFEEVKAKAKAITPVPGGVGPMTVTALLMNTLKSYKNRIHSISTIKP